MLEAVEDEEGKEFWGLGLYKESSKLTVYPIPGKPPGRPMETESNLGFSRSTAPIDRLRAKKIYIFLAISVDWVGRPCLY